MNCEHIEELLPLYVGRDLEEEQARLVTAHVQSCTQCARSAEQYGEANQLLQLFEPPQFSEATYATVRSRVLREIEGQSSTPGQGIFTLAFLRPFFRPQVVWAASTVVLLAACLFAYYFLASRTSGSQNVPLLAANPGAGEQKATDKQVNAGSPNDKSIRERRSAPTGPAGGPPAAKTPPQKLRLHQAAQHPRRAGGTPVVPERTAKYSAEPKGAAPNASATADKTLRLEIQTTNPNVRIIWFSQSSTKEGSPSESSKGI